MAFIPDRSVAIILVNWNGLDYTQACLNSLRKLDFPDYKIILVDNGSENQEGPRIKNAFPEIELIENSENVGFAGGNNLGIRVALDQGFTHLLLLNNDTLVEPGFLGEMMQKFHQSQDLGVVQPLILFLHDPKKIWSAGGKWIPSLSRAITLGDRAPLMDYRIKDYALDWATGCCMLISREAILASGLLNEQYFAYFEDVEWSLRFRKAGYGIALAEKAIVYHEASASSKKQHAEGVLSPRVFYYHVRNQFFLVRTEGNAAGITYHFFRFMAWAAYFLARGRFIKLKSVLRGIRDGMTVTLKPIATWP